MKTTIKLAMLLTLSCFMLVSSSCKKVKRNACGEEIDGFSEGGLISKPEYIFYVPKDYGGGPITVTIKDDEGVIVFKGYDSKVLSIFEPSGPINPCNTNNQNYSKRAHYTLDKGRKYSYTAVCETKSWKGEINVPCEFQTCNIVELE